MKLHLADFPQPVSQGGYVYALAFSNGFVKVGMSTKPGVRIAVHQYNGSRFGIEVTDWWVSPPHLNYSETEQALIAIARALGPDDHPTAKSAEYYGGIDFAELVQHCRELQIEPMHVPIPETPLPGPASTPVSDGADVISLNSQPQKVLLAQRHRVAARPRRSHGRTAAQRGPFGALISEARLRSGLSQDDLVSRTGVSRSTLVRWENGKSDRPELDQVRAVCLAIGVRPIDAAVALGLLMPEDLNQEVAA